MTEIKQTKDGMGYMVHVGGLKAFVSSMHLVPDKEAQLRRLNKQAKKASKWSKRLAEYTTEVVDA